MAAATPASTGSAATTAASTATNAAAATGRGGGGATVWLSIGATTTGVTADPDPSVTATPAIAITEARPAMIKPRRFFGAMVAPGPVGVAPFAELSVVGF